MWINFESKGIFRVKVHIGGVNVIFGSTGVEELATTARQQALLSNEKSLQDYVVTPGQDWLDGIATFTGVVNQFVATTIGTGVSIEAQMTGQKHLELRSPRKMKLLQRHCDLSLKDRCRRFSAIFQFMRLAGTRSAGYKP